MSKIYNQVEEITQFLLDKDVNDIDTLYEKLVSRRERKIDCFRERKIDEKKMLIRYEDISMPKFKRIVQLMAKINILKIKPVGLLDENKEALEIYNERKFDSLLEVTIKDYLSEHDIIVSDLRDKIIQKIKYPDLRNARTIHEKLKRSGKEKKMVGIQDFSKLLTLLADIGVLERKSSTLFF
jgi:hypothetical protein